MKRRSYRFFWLLIVVGVFLFTRDLYEFNRICHQYGREAGGLLLPKEVFKDEAIVVLTGDRYRIPKALELLRTRGTPHLVISGTGRGISLTELVNQQGGSTINIHSIWKKITVESRSQSTLENAEETARFVSEWEIRHLILVTSEYHMRRSSLIFRRVFPKVDLYEYPVRSDFTLAAGQFSQRTVNGLWNFWVEYWKLLLYRFYYSSKLTIDTK